jgi:hypothetical protein
MANDIRCFDRRVDPGFSFGLKTGEKQEKKETIERKTIENKRTVEDRIGEWRTIEGEKVLNESNQVKRDGEE